MCRSAALCLSPLRSRSLVLTFPQALQGLSTGKSNPDVNKNTAVCYFPLLFVIVPGGK